MFNLYCKHLNILYFVRSLQTQCHKAPAYGNALITDMADKVKTLCSAMLIIIIIFFCNVYYALIPLCSRHLHCNDACENYKKFTLTFL